MKTDRVPYRSPLRAIVNLPSVVTYVCSHSNSTVGKVYKTKNGKWFLATSYLAHWQPFEVFTKYQGFLFLKSLHEGRTN